MKEWYLIGLVLSISFSASAQSLNRDDIDFLNKEIRFLNESIHRMVIVFQIYENYNSEITRHVDLPKNEGIQNTSEHLPENLFADNDLVRRGDSPLDLYNELEEDSHRKIFPINNWSLINGAKRIIDVLNKDRRQLDNIIKNEDLEQFSNIQTIYGEIEQAGKLFDDLSNGVKIFEKLILQSYHDLVLPEQEKQIFTALTELHYDIKKMVRQLRYDNQSEVINGVTKLERELVWVKTCIAQLTAKDQRSDLLSVVTSIEKLITEFQNYVKGTAVPSEYSPFGQGYYYHNYEILPKINQYGSGYVWKLEEFFKKYNWPVINFLEEPHNIKIVYPSRIPLEVMKGEGVHPQTSIRDISDTELPKLDHLVVRKNNAPDKIIAPQPEEEVAEPVAVKEIPTLITYSQVINVDTTVFELLLFDHLQKDGDRVSINVNGEWIFNQISLERKSRILKLSINPGGPNYIIIRADNEGWRTPNTIGVKYRSKNAEQDVFIKKDLSTSEAIEIKFTY